MIWGGETVLVTWGYKPITTWAVSYGFTADGYPAAKDRGAAQDIYESSVVFKGPESELATLETVLAANRQAFSITCGTGEEIFGADVSYASPLSVTVVDYGQIERVSYGQYAMPMRLRLPAPTFKATSPSLSALRLSGWRYGAFSSFPIAKQFSYSGSASYIDHRTDSGVFMGDFTQTTAEMEAIRRALTSSIRGQDIQFPSFGITKPFGQRRVDRQWLKAHVLEWEDLGRENFSDWRLRIYFAEADPYFSAGYTDGDTLVDHLTAGTSGEPGTYGTPGG